MVIIDESGMRFGEYSEADVFHIEKSDQYKNGLLPNGVKCCEFILMRSGDLCFVEAKSSCPNAILADTIEEKREKYNAYIDDIADKMRHTLALYANILLKRHEAAGVPDNLLETDLSSAKIKLVLVVKNSRSEWLMPLKDKLSKVLKSESKLWKLDDFYVINEETARRKRFVV